MFVASLIAIDSMGFRQVSGKGSWNLSLAILTSKQSHSTHLYSELTQIKFLHSQSKSAISVFRDMKNCLNFYTLW